jgi:UDP-N-acetylmuramate dehydrogenase
LRVGGAKVSEMHCNFLINDRQATGEDVEKLGETVRARVKATSGITLNWEIIRLGQPTPGHPIGEGLANLNSPVDQAQS